MPDREDIIVLLIVVVALGTPIIVAVIDLVNSFRTGRRHRDKQ